MRIWLNRKSVANRFVSVLIGLGAICGLLTYAALANVPPFGNSSNALIVLLNVNLVILLTLLIVVCRRIIALYILRKKGIVGSNLHIRLVFIFSLLTALPAIFMAVFSVGFFYFGLHGWLDSRVKDAVNESQAVAEAYLSEHQQLIRADILALATDLDRQAPILRDNLEAMEKMLKTQSFLRNFSNIVLFQNDIIVLQSDKEGDFSSNDVPPAIIGVANEGDIAILEKGQEGITAVLKLNNYLDLYLYAERLIDPKVLGHLERAKKGVAQYEELERYSTRLQILLTLIYVAITLLLTIAAIWYGLSFARRLIKPIAELIEASEDVRAGDLSARVDTSTAMDEFKMLGHAFNRMTEQIESQQTDMVNTNSMMDIRRRFTETILGGVSTGVISLNDDRVVTLANNAASDLLHFEINEFLNQKISYVMPELVPFLDEAFQKNDLGVVTTCEVQIRRQDKAVRTFIARIVVELLDNNKKGAIVTFDDLTAVLASQRKAAWADVARRIAHEIKNPLTPIQLSAERLNRKYRGMLSDDDKKIFDQCTETIIRHVGDIKIMVNSFSEFAKMPDAIMEKRNILPIIKDTYALNKNAHDRVTFELIEGDKLPEKITVAFDEQQIRQVLTNLIKNAVEACEGRDKPSLATILTIQNNKLIIGVADNGDGLPDNIDFEKLSEPYVTHKEKGTGLGLAIVKKIMEDHKGSLLYNPDMGITNISRYRTLIAVSIPLWTEGGLS